MTLRVLTPALAGMVCLLALPAAAQDDLIGTYYVRGKSRKGSAISGRLVVKPKGQKALTLSSTLKGHDPIAAAGPISPKRSWRFNLDAPTTVQAGAKRSADHVGATGVLGREPQKGDADAKTKGTTATAKQQRFLEVLPKDTQGRFYKARIVRGEETLATLKLQRRHRVLVAWDASRSGAEHNAFKGNAAKVVRYYRGRGMSVDELPLTSERDGWFDIMKAFDKAYTEGFRFTRVVTVGHGGWDGPIFPRKGSYSARQISTQTSKESWVHLVNAFKYGTAPNARIYFSGCHTGGSDRYELQNGDSSYRFVLELAKAIERRVAGPAGYTSARATLPQTKATLENTGGVKQETWIGSKAGVRKIPYGRARATARTKAWPSDK